MQKVFLFIACFGHFCNLLTNALMQK